MCVGLSLETAFLAMFALWFCTCLQTKVRQDGGQGHTVLAHGPCEQPSRYRAETEKVGRDFAGRTLHYVG